MNKKAFRISIVFLILTGVFMFVLANIQTGFAMEAQKRLEELRLEATLNAEEAQKQKELAQQFTIEARRAEFEVIEISKQLKMCQNQKNAKN